MSCGANAAHSTIVVKTVAQVCVAHRSREQIEPVLIFSLPRLIIVALHGGVLPLVLLNYDIVAVTQHLQATVSKRVNARVEFANTFIIFLKSLTDIHSLFSFISDKLISAIYYISF